MNGSRSDEAARRATTKYKIWHDDTYDVSDTEIEIKQVESRKIKDDSNNIDLDLVVRGFNFIAIAITQSPARQ